jgi:hypothetical protein
MKTITVTKIISALFIAAFITILISSATAETLFWKGIVFSNLGTPVTTPSLELGEPYRIVSSYRFWYNITASVQADAQYYTNATAQYDLTNWDNHYPAPNGHSFLQINGTDVNWGSFSNGDSNHAYSIEYAGRNESISFQIVDWMDQDYLNNNCHFDISIYRENGTDYVTYSYGFTVLVAILAIIASIIILRKKRKKQAQYSEIRHLLR